VSQKLGNKKKGIKGGTSGVSTRLPKPTEMQLPPRTQSLSSTLKEHPVFVVLSLLAAFLVGAGTVIPASGYVAEKWHETIATIDMGAVDQKKPLSTPLEIKNPSALFDMHNVGVACRFKAAYKQKGLFIPDAGTNGWHGPTFIAAGQSAVFFCNWPDLFTMTDNATGEIATIESATMVVAVIYETWVHWSIARRTPDTTFTLLNTTGGFQWVKGTIIK
jgi:hypothetical protein